MLQRLGSASLERWKRTGSPRALGGVLALGAHGVPRGTLDVDVNVFCHDFRRRDGDLLTPGPHA